MSVLFPKRIQGLTFSLPMNKMPKSFREVAYFLINIIECLLCLKEKEITLGAFISYHIYVF